MEVVTLASAPKQRLVLRRGEGSNATYAFLNNVDDGEASPVQYCVWSFPAPEDGMVWVDGLTDEMAVFENSCYTAPDAAPKILIQVPAESTYRPEPASGTNRPEPDSGTNRPEPDSGTYRPEPDSGTNRPEPDSAAYRLKPDSASYLLEPDSSTDTSTYHLEPGSSTEIHASA